MFSSTLERARQTAMILTRALGIDSPITPLNELGPDSEPASLFAALDKHGVSGGQVLLVGHQPLLGRLVAHLTGREQPLAPGQLIRIDCSEASHSGCRVSLSVRPDDTD